MALIASRLRHLVLVLLVGLALIPAGLAYSADPVTVRLAMATFDSLDPVSLPRADWAARDVAENLFLGLTRYDPVSRTIQPALAREWKVSDDGLTWTFELRTDVQWVTYNPQNQQIEAVRPVVAGDFVYAIRRACHPEPPNPATHTAYIIAGCRKIATTSAHLIDEPFIARELRVEALSDRTLRVKLEFPAPYFISIAALPELRAVPREAIDHDTDWTKPGTIITDGPWVMTDWTRGQQMTLVRNPLWPDALTGNVERVAISFGTPDAVAQQFASGSADLARLDAQVVPTIRQARPDASLLTAVQSVTMLGFSLERPAVANESFRRALSQAIDRDDLVKTALPGMALPASRFTPLGVIGAPQDRPDNRGFAPDSAKAALIASGLVACRPPEKLTFLVDDQPLSTAVAQAIIGQWQATLGCNPAWFSIRTASASVVQSVAHNAVNAEIAPRPHLWIFTWSADYPDANAWTGDALHCQFGFLRSGLACGEADKLVDAAALETDPAKRAEAYSQAETIWFGPAGTFPVAPLYMTFNVVGIQRGLTGVMANGPARFDLWAIRPG
jgi:oligopeptide transport system substrate-binding protein